MDSVQLRQILFTRATVSSPFFKGTGDPGAQAWSTLGQRKLDYLPQMTQLGVHIDVTHEVFRLFRNIAHPNCQTYIVRKPLPLLIVWSWTEVLNAFALKKSEGQLRVLDFAVDSNRVYFLDLYTNVVHSRQEKPVRSCWDQIDNFATACTWYPFLPTYIDVDGLDIDQMRQILKEQQSGVLHDGLKDLLLLV